VSTAYDSSPGLHVSTVTAMHMIQDRVQMNLVAKRHNIFNPLHAETDPISTGELSNHSRFSCTRCTSLGGHRSDGTPGGIAKLGLSCIALLFAPGEGKIAQWWQRDTHMGSLASSTASVGGSWRINTTHWLWVRNPPARPRKGRPAALPAWAASLAGQSLGPAAGSSCARAAV